MTVITTGAVHSSIFGKVFAKQRAKSRVFTRELLFADDTALCTHDENHLQDMTDKFSTACTAFGLTISQKKTQVIG